jgi:predicted alpha-1,2-mannosidase
MYLFRNIIRYALLIIILTWGYEGIGVQPSKKIISFVNPLIGSENEGHIFVGASLPWSMVKLGPDCGDNQSNSGYYHSSAINGFSHLHVSGTGGGPKYGNILVMPFTGKFKLGKMGSFAHDEDYRPGAFSVYLDRFNVKAEMTLTPSVGLHKYTFPKDSDARILVDAGHFLHYKKGNPESQYFVGSEIRILSDHEAIGYNKIRGGWGMGRAYTVYFYIIFDNPFSSFATWKGCSVYNNVFCQPDTGEKTGAYFIFDSRSNDVVQAKVGISFISQEKARLNVVTEAPSWDFEDKSSQAFAAWDRILSKVTVEGGTEELKTMLYTGLYHGMLMPSNRSGENPLWKSSEPYYDDFYAIWDTFRTLHPLLTLLVPSIQIDIVRAMIDIYRYDGYLPDARSGNDNGRTQGGSNADVVITDAFVKGLKGIDYETALSAMIKNAEISPGSDQRKEGRGGISDYNTIGYVSTDYERAGTRTTEYSVCDFAIATLANGMEKVDIAKKYLDRSNNWRNLWRPIEAYGAKGFLWPRRKDGSWVEDFSTTKGGGWKSFFYETKSWELSTYVPHDIPQLIDSCGGMKKFEGRLDTLFNTSTSDRNGWSNLYNVCNEPGFLAPCLYHWIGKPEKSAACIRSLIATYFNSTVNGLPENDDSGAMSTWLVFNLMGIFPIAGQDLYLITTPHFSSIRIELENGKLFVIKANNLSSENNIVISAKLNGNRIFRSWIRHTEICNGAILELEMGKKTMSWGNVSVYKTRLTE